MNNIITLTPVIAGTSFSLAGIYAFPDDSKPDVIIILTDDMRYEDISCYNKNQIKTTNIGQLAAEGVRLTDFYDPTPYSAPSGATLLIRRFSLR